MKTRALNCQDHSKSNITILLPKDIEIELPLTNTRMKELQEQDPLVGRLRKQWSEKKLDRKHFTMEDEILKKETVINGILYTPTVLLEVIFATNKILGSKFLCRR